VANVFAELQFTNYEENIKLTDYGREVSVKIVAIIRLEPKYFSSSWTYIFDKTQKIKLINAKVSGKKQVGITFNNNELNFKFDKAFNNSILTFEFTYREVSDFLYNRQEWVSIPPFMKDANATVVVNVPNNYLVYSSLNDIFTRNYNVYTWKGKIPESGISDSFFLTLKKTKWKVFADIEINSPEPLKILELSMPIYFRGGTNKVLEYKVNTEGKVEEKKDYFKVNFNKLKLRQAYVEVDAIVQKDLENKEYITLDPVNYLKVSSNKTKNVLQNIIFEIQTKNGNVPLHKAIIQYVYDNITYNLNYFGRDMTTEDILRIKQGVCEQYALLYMELARTAGIPTITVSGMSYNKEQRKFDNHAWNISFINGEWVELDPTWNISSGILPSTHIFFNFKNKSDEIQWETTTNGTTNRFDRGVEFLGEQI
jgi:hypothetical protein